MTDVIMLQTSDEHRYARMLDASGYINSKYCYRYKFQYEQHRGVLRGHHPWQACFNRIIILKNLIDSGYRGWAFYLDADAYVYDHDFDVVSYLESNSSYAMIAAPGGATGQQWDINDGVLLVNLQLEEARSIIQLWNEDFLSTSEDDLKNAPNWHDVASDQPRLHRVLQNNPHLAKSIKHEPREFPNHYNASFVRQVLRTNAPTLEERVEIMERDVNAVTLKYGYEPLNERNDHREEEINRTPPSTIYSFKFNGSEIASSVFGNNYLEEFSRILEISGRKCRKKVLEWGSGLTSLVLTEYCKAWNAEIFLTLDENGPYQKAIFEGKETPSFLVAKTISAVGTCVDQKDPGLNYSSYPLSLGTSFDLIFIDGRRRVECAYTAALLSHNDTVVIVHDYRRSRYQSMLGLFEIVEDGPQFRVMRLRPGVYEALMPGRESVRAFMNALSWHSGGSLG